MKPIATPATLAAILLTVASCSSLDMEPESDITDLNYWKTPSQYEAFVRGLHSRMRAQSWNLFLLGEGRGDTFGGIPFGGEATQGMERFPYNTLNAENPGVSGFGGLYQNLNQMNLFISRAAGAAVLAPAVRDRYLGQVHGLRAFYLYQLYRSWGGVVFTPEPSLGFEVGSLAKAPAPAEDIMRQIESDLASSADRFGGDYGLPEGRDLWSLPATLMLRADVSLWNARRGGGERAAREALDALAAVRANVGEDALGLLDSYAEVFAYDRKGNREIIFALHNELFESVLWGGNGDLYPQADYLGSFCNADGTPIDTSVENNFGVMRLMVKPAHFLAFLPGDTRRDVTLKDVYQSDGEGRLELAGLYPRKYRGVMDGSVRVRADDFPVYRYADLLLMEAEARVLLGLSPADELNAVRRRAFGADYDEALLGYPRQEGDADPEAAVLRERFFEFMLEGKRWYDLRRFGDEYVLAHTPAEAARLLWPVDRQSLTNNPLLEQTPGY